jgi:hypothetical protein
MVQRARHACGWHLQVNRKVEALPPPAAEERHRIRRFDPYGDLWG